MWDNDFAPEDVVEREGLKQINDEKIVLSWVLEAIEASTKSVTDYKKGKLTASKAIIGKAMALSEGKANPILVQKLTERELDRL